MAASKIPSRFITSNVKELQIVVPSASLIYSTVINDASVTLTSKINISWGNYPDSAENFGDNDIILNAQAKSGQITIQMESINDKKFRGKFYINYINN